MDIRRLAEEHNDVGVLIHLEEINANILEEFKAVGELFHFGGINSDLIEGLNAVGNSISHWILLDMYHQPLWRKAVRVVTLLFCTHRIRTGKAKSTE